ncbi:MAG: hypothetical protein SOR53_01775, partial [Oscillospiraceae bacterium]|nr:hypothetical protein [Oscillospiraceae bacterium]
GKNLPGAALFYRVPSPYWSLYWSGLTNTVTNTVMVPYKTGQHQAGFFRLVLFFTDFGIIFLLHPKSCQFSVPLILPNASVAN